MELLFQPRTMKYLRQIADEVVSQEETMEWIVPDSFPDVERIVMSSACIMLRNRECRGGGATASGGIRASTLYVPADGSAPRSLEMYLPFTAKIENAAMAENAALQVTAAVRGADARILNSRKIVLRVGYTCRFMEFATAEETFYDLRETPDELQLRTAQYPMMLPMETAERTFTVAEDVAFPAGVPQQMLSVSPRLEITEQRVTGSKAVFKGSADVRFLYMDAEEHLCVHEVQIPFSQYCELDGGYDDEEMTLRPTLCSLETEPVSLPEGERLTVTLRILAQCTVCARQMVTLVEDAYCLGAEFKPRWQAYDLPARLDLQTMAQSVRETCEGAVDKIVLADVYLDPCEVSRAETGTQIIVPASANLLYYDPEGTLQGMTVHPRAECRMELAADAACGVQAELAGDPWAAPVGGGAELRYTIALRTESLGGGQYRGLAGGEISPEQEEAGERPAVIVRRTRRGESLWDIAKRNRTTVGRIRSANHLEDADTEYEGVLLIPL